MTSSEDRKARADNLRGQMDAVLASGRSLRWDALNTSAERLMQKYLKDTAKWAVLLEEAEAELATLREEIQNANIERNLAD